MQDLKYLYAKKSNSLSHYNVTSCYLTCVKSVFQMCLACAASAVVHVWVLPEKSVALGSTRIQSNKQPALPITCNSIAHALTCTEKHMNTFWNIYISHYKCKVHRLKEQINLFIFCVLRTINRWNTGTVPWKTNSEFLLKDCIVGL